MEIQGTIIENKMSPFTQFCSSKELSQNYKLCDPPPPDLMSISEHGNKGTEKVTELAKIKQEVKNEGPHSPGLRDYSHAPLDTRILSEK